jgi:hypothetical protein
MRARNEETLYVIKAQVDKTHRTHPGRGDIAVGQLLMVKRKDKGTDKCRQVDD